MLIAMMTMVMMMMMVMRGHRGPSNYICSKCRSCCSSPSSGCHCTLLIIWPGKHLYLTRYHSCTFVFVFEDIPFLYFCICIWPNNIFVLLSLLHLSKHAVLDALYFRKGHSHSFTWRQTNASESKSKYVAQTQTRIVAFNICDKDLKSSNICIHCALVVYIMRYYLVLCHLKWRCTKSGWICSCTEIDPQTRVFCIL